MNKTLDKNKRRGARKARGAGAPLNGAIARLKADNAELRAKIAKLGAGLGPYMDAAEAAVTELQDRVTVLTAVADGLVESLRVRQVRLVPVEAGGLDGAHAMLTPGCEEVQAAQIAPGSFVLFLAGTPTEPDRLQAMGDMIRNFGERRGVSILPMAATDGRSVGEAFGLYRVEHVSAKVEPEPAQVHDDASPPNG